MDRKVIAQRQRSSEHPLQCASPNLVNFVFEVRQNCESPRLRGTWSKQVDARLRKGRRIGPFPQSGLGFGFRQLVEADLDRSFGLYLLVSPVIYRLKVHGRRIIFAAFLGDVRQTVGKNVRRQFTNAEFTDLSTAKRQLSQVTFQALAYEPVLFQTLRVHAFAVVDNGDRCSLVVEVRWQQDGDAQRTRVKTNWLPTPLSPCLGWRTGLRKTNVRSDRSTGRQSSRFRYRPSSRSDHSSCSESSFGHTALGLPSGGRTSIVNQLTEQRWRIGSASRACELVLSKRVYRRFEFAKDSI